jgi:hypothetical protein
MDINDIHGHSGNRAEPAGKSCRQSEFFSVQRGAPVHQQLASIALARHDGPAAVLSR